MHKRLIIITTVFYVFIFLTTTAFTDEGMWPMSEIHKLDLQAKGFDISAKEIYNPTGISLVDGICKINGCTGSFVSAEGLILTNHHCAFSAVQDASTKENDYIKNGFLAQNRSQEIQAKGYTVRITESYQDVSKDVLSAVTETMKLSERTKAIEKKIKEIVKEAEKQHLNKRASVAEMFIGKTYVLFIYSYLKDVRLVYAPPRSIGEFGGETDNWVWPRHTGDFSFMRVYTAPDGFPAEYSADNVPYQPKKHLKVCPDGVNEQDFVFIFGYPGKTYRHRTSHYLSYEQEIRMPYVEKLYHWQISVMEYLGKNDRSITLKQLSRIKGRSNTMKNYRGKLKGLRRLQLVEKKQEEENDLQRFIVADKARKEKYGTVLNEIGKVYEEIRAQAEYSLILDYLKRSSIMLSAANTVYEASVERPKDDIERESAYMDRNFPRTKKRLRLTLNDYYEPTDKIFLKEMLTRAVKLPKNQRIPAVDNIIKDAVPEHAINNFIEKAYGKSKLNDENFLTTALSKSSQELKKINDPFINLAEALYPTYQKLREIRRTRKGALDKLFAKLAEVKKQVLAKDFIPDANSTLRLTFGRIRGYSPADGIYYNPITTVTGVYEKTTGNEPFDTPQEIINLYKAKDFGKFRHPKLNSVPTCILYDMDTTGGNSGSPVLNARGELVGVNFDRTFEATINDYAWNTHYSRSIAVDIRYVLWVTQKFGGAEYLLEEMGVSY